jgi:tetratricopeptide (TPR) repeat protein
MAKVGLKYQRSSKNRVWQASLGVTGWGRLEVAVFTGAGLILAGLIWAWMAGLEDQRLVRAKNALYAVEKKEEKLKSDQIKEKIELITDLEKVSQEFPLISFSAQMQIAALRFKNEQYAESLQAYQKAKGFAKKPFEKVQQMLGEAYSLENLTKTSEALASFQATLTLINMQKDIACSAFRGEVLFSLARCYENLKDKDNALKIYDQIIKDFYNTAYAKTAEAYRTLL